MSWEESSIRSEQPIPAQFLSDESSVLKINYNIIDDLINSTFRSLFKYLGILIITVL